MVTLENGKLVQKQCWDGKETNIEREISDGKLIAVSTCAADCRPLKNVQRKIKVTPSAIIMEEELWKKMYSSCYSHCFSLQSFFASASRLNLSPPSSAFSPTEMHHGRGGGGQDVCQGVLRRPPPPLLDCQAQFNERNTKKWMTCIFFFCFHYLLFPYLCVFIHYFDSVPQHNTLTFIWTCGDLNKNGNLFPPPQKKCLSEFFSLMSWKSGFFFFLLQRIKSLRSIITFLPGFQVAGYCEECRSFKEEKIH